jgi:MFS family permease
MRILGPAVAAFLVASFGAASCYLADSVSFIGSALLIFSVAFLPAAKTPIQQASGLARVWLDMKQGINFIIHHAGLLFVILALACGMFVIGCFGPLIAVYVRDDLHASTQVFGIASALIGVGMLLGVNALAAFAKNAKSATLVYAALAGIGLGLLILAFASHVWTTFLGTLVIGFAVAGIIIPSQTMIQQETPQALMGRVGSTVMSLVFTAQISGLVLSGILANSLGVREVFIGCAILLGLLIAVGRIWMEPTA